MRRGGPRHTQQGKRREGEVVETLLSERERGRIIGNGNNRYGQVNASLSVSKVK